ncbi:hypothetical protein TIFTF001_009060, partial [Ficus carica]
MGVEVETEFQDGGTGFENKVGFEFLDRDRGRVSGHELRSGFGTGVGVEFLDGGRV